MALRFRKSIKLAPGIRLNLSKSGMSLTTGPHGASMNFGARGTYLNTGIPGTGFYSRKHLGRPAQNKTSQTTAYKAISIKVDDEAGILYQDGQGNPLPPEHVALAKRQNGSAIKQMLKEACDEINARQETLAQLHFMTPPPLPPKYQPPPFQEAAPVKPKIRGLGLLGRLFESRKKMIEEKNILTDKNYEEALELWQSRKAQYEASQEETRLLIEEKVWTDQKAMYQVLENSLSDIYWPRETNVEFEIRDDGNEVWLDVDLPEIEDIPTKLACVTGRGFEFEYRESSETRTRKLYMEHVHSIGFRLVGEVFAVLPKCQAVILSGYSQRNERSTGQITKQYLYSIRIKRDNWKLINFANLKGLDAVDALAKFECRRNMTKTGHFKEIQPFDK